MGLKLYIIWFLLLCGFTSTSSLPEPSLLEPRAQNLWRSWPNPAQPSLAEKERNLTVQIGNTVRMPCKVSNLHDKTISWIRGSDLTVLAVDTVTYTGDHRFSVIHAKDSEEWHLELVGVLKTDEGLYDCQINTYPKISTKIYLHIVPKHAVQNALFDRPVSDTDMPRLESGGAWKQLVEDPVYSGYQDSYHYGISLKINGRAWIQMDVGSTLHLTCEATGSWIADRKLSGVKLSQQERILGWNLDDVPVTVLFPEWKVEVEESWGELGLESKLTISSVAPEDSGKLTCVAPNTKGAFIHFNVKEDKTTKQHYLGLSKGKMQDEQHQHTHPVISAVSGAASGFRNQNNKFAVLCAVVLIVLMLTNIAVCVHHLRRV